MLEPNMCLVFEDSESGIRAAKYAGMKVVGVSRDRNHKRKLEKADMIIEDYFEITPGVLNKFE
jgi:beta-phosphoglucomutase-like phosphatase (HAD superfamily)